MGNFWVPFTRPMRGKGINGFAKLTNTQFLCRVCYYGEVCAFKSATFVFGYRCWILLTTTSGFPRQHISTEQQMLTLMTALEVSRSILRWSLQCNFAEEPCRETEHLALDVESCHAASFPNVRISRGWKRAASQGNHDTWKPDVYSVARMWLHAKTWRGPLVLFLSSRCEIGLTK